MYVIVNKGGFLEYGGEQFPAVIDAHIRLYETQADQDINNFKIVEADKAGKLQSLIIKNKRELSNMDMPTAKEPSINGQESKDIEYLKREIDYLKSKVKKPKQEQPPQFSLKAFFKNLIIFIFNLTIIPILLIYLLIVLGG